jgi:hypothetical protein
MLMCPAMPASDPIRQRRPSHGKTFFGNILDEAMRVKFARRGTTAFLRLCAKATQARALVSSPAAWRRSTISALSATRASSALLPGS